LAREHQQFGIDGQQFSGGLFEFPPGLNAWTNGVEPLGRNGFDSLLASSHEGEGGERMTIAVSAVARRLSAAAMRNHERAWKSIVRQMEASQQEAGTAAESGSFGPTGCRNAGHYLMVIIQSDKHKTIHFANVFQIA
jgi:hypothetical protein